MKNILGIEVTKPDKQLIIFRGCSGAGKSTLARNLSNRTGSLVHSTDSLIEEIHEDYNKFFKDMIEKNDFSPLHKMHKLCLKNAKKDMDIGITPVIIDNTNIKPWEPKEFIMYALNLGYADENIKIADIGDAGFTAEELFERNTHNVPMDKIRSMIDSHKAHSPLTLEKIINSKSPFDKVLYSAIMLDHDSRIKLKDMFVNECPENWQVFIHHQTIIFGKELPENLKEDLDKEITLTVTHIGKTDKIVAVKTLGYENLDGKVPHITLFVDIENNGSPKMSGDIVDWNKLEKQFNVKGIIKEIKK